MSSEVPGGAPLVATVSTVKASVGYLQQFVDRNLAAGADHMLLFVDDADPGVVGALEAHPQVTAIPTDDRYWDGKQPTGLNARQGVNANLANLALCLVPALRWLFHLDADEVLAIDKDRLRDLPDRLDVVRLQTQEAVSQFHPEVDGSLFKRPLTHEELCLLNALDVIARPSMRVYFRGHQHKAGLRPHLQHYLRIHEVTDCRGVKLDAYTAEWLRVFHYESHSGEDFVRKWTAHLSSGGGVLRAERAVLAHAIAAVANNSSLTDVHRQELLERLYHRHVEDDVDILRRLGYLVSPPEGSVPTGGLAVEDAEVLRRCVAHFAAGDKSHFQLADRTPPGSLLESLRRDCGPGDDLLAARLDALLGHEAD